MQQKICVTALHCVTLEPVGCTVHQPMTYVLMFRIFCPENANSYVKHDFHCRKCHLHLVMAKVSIELLG